MSAFAAISDPTRRRILEILAEGERPAGELVREFRMSQPAVSQHLRSLREARLVSARSEGPRRYYRLDREGFEEIERWMARTRAGWNARLNDLEAQVTKAPERRGGRR